MRLFIALFTAVPMLFIAIGGMNVARQHAAVAGVVPTTARGLAAGYSISTRTDGKGHRTTRYPLSVAYQFDAGGTPYLGRYVYPHFQALQLRDLAGEKRRPTPGAPPGLEAADEENLESVTDRARADALVAQFAEGKSFPAYYDPKDPVRAFLIRRIDFGPYWFVLVPMLHLSIGLGLAAAGVGRRPPRSAPARGRGGAAPAPRPDRAGWYPLTPRRPLARRTRPWAVVTVVWYAVGGVFGGHYLYLCAFRPEPVALYTLVGYAGLGLLPLIAWIRARRLTRGLAEVSAWVDDWPLRPGRSFRARCEQTVRPPLPVARYRMGLIGVAALRPHAVDKSPETPGLAHEEWAELESPGPADPGKAIALKATFKIPAPAGDGAAPDSPAARPRLSWSLRVIAEFSGRPAYRADFPLEVGEEG